MTLLMVLGNAGLVTAVSTFVLSSVGTGTAAQLLERSVLLLAASPSLSLQPKASASTEC